MELYIKDRLFIPSFLPQEGTFKQFNIKKGILKKIEITPQERDDVELRTNEENERIEWNNEKDVPLTVEFTQEEMEYLKEVCEQMSDEIKRDEIWLTVVKVYDSIQEAMS